MPNYQETLEEILNRKTAKIPLEIYEQYELRGRLISALVRLGKLEASVENYKNSLKALSDLVQELLEENKRKDRELSMLKANKETTL